MLLVHLEASHQLWESLLWGWMLQSEVMHQELQQ